MAKKFRKIEIVETNNEANIFLYSGQGVFPVIEEKYLKQLRVYVEKKSFKLRGKTELDEVLNVLKWVTAQWKHDGMNQPPAEFNALDILKAVYKNSERYRCVEYGLVLSEVLQAYGFLTRSLSLRSVDVAYGSFGMGHVAMEVWVNELNKWIFLDPQFGTYLTRQDQIVPLNFYEAFVEKKKNRWKQLKVQFVVAPDETIQKASKGYKKFLKDYFGHFSVRSGKEDPGIGLFLESNIPPVTFQGLPLNNTVFTDRVEMLYPMVNRVVLTLKFQLEGLATETFQQMVKKYKIETNEEYLDKMHLFAVEPKFKVKVIPKMPNFSYVEYRKLKNDKWQKIKGTEFSWEAMEAKNLIEVRGVNKYGRPGPVTFIKMSYQ